MNWNLVRQKTIGSNVFWLAVLSTIAAWGPWAIDVAQHSPAAIHTIQTVLALAAVAYKWFVSKEPPACYVGTAVAKSKHLKGKHP